ncbi:unnamed protein product [Rodentolepis nana]|uniref:NPL domain-containing protein n=1 Tax=Rodentolepis nana TaxID=102285 RepID=A0A0R3U0P0_RODNA|nr:unnamed protein product [Rodentolepis nana]
MKSKHLLQSEYHAKNGPRIAEFNSPMEDELDNYDTETISVILPDEALMFFLHTVGVLTSKKDSTPAIIMPSNVKSQERIHFLEEKGSFLCVWDESTSSYAIGHVPNGGYSLASIESAESGTKVQFLRPQSEEVIALTSRDLVGRIDGPVIAKPSNYKNQIVPLNVSSISQSGVSFKDLANIVNAIYCILPHPHQEFPWENRTCMCQQRTLQQMENSKSNENDNKVNNEKTEPSNLKISAPRLNYWPQLQDRSEKTKLNVIDCDDDDDNKEGDSIESVKSPEYTSRNCSEELVPDSKVTLEKDEDLFEENLEEEDRTSDHEDYSKSSPESDSEANSSQTSDYSEVFS